METLRLLGMGAFDLDLPFFRGHIYYLWGSGEAASSIQLLHECTLSST